jgi:uncharacterized protein
MSASPIYASPTMLTTPLNDDEYDALDDLLAEIGGQAMDVAELEGFVTALVTGPRVLPQNEWLAKVWGGGEGNEAATALVLRHHHHMQTWMSKDPGSFEPIYECGGSWTADAWCKGFLAGVALDASTWAPLQTAQPALFEAFANGDDVTQSVIKINAHWHPPKGPKVGRNDPCPCGSGKKFKKCCDA